MSILKNMKIRGKLFVGFGVLLIALLVVAVMGIYDVIQINENYSNVVEYNVFRYSQLQDLSGELMNVRRLVALTALQSGQFPGELGTIEELEAQAIASVERTGRIIGRFRDNLLLDPSLEEADRQGRVAQINEVERLIYYYMDNTVESAMQAARDGRDYLQAGGITIAEFRYLAVLAIVDGQGTMAEIESIYVPMMAVLQEFMDTVVEDMNASTNATMVLLITISAIAFIVGIAAALFISGVITKPITEVVNSLSDMAQGRLNINLRADTNDEVGALSKSAISLVQTLQTLMGDMDTMAEDHAKGEIDTFIDEAKFQGSFEDVANKINELVKSQLNTQNQVVGTFVEIAGGNFKADLAQQPGKKAALNDAVNGMRDQINAVAGEINFLIDAAAVKGNLNVNIKESDYDGGWRDIMVGLNSLAEAVNNPITEIRDAISNLGRGAFDVKVNGDYPGDFGVIKTAVNGTIDALDGYISEMSSTLSSISQGDLTRSISRDYIGEFSAIKESINNISTTLNKTMSEISAASAQVLSGANQISTSAMQLANGATEQASSIEELNASIDMINQQTRQNAENASEATGLSGKSSENAEKGNEAVKHMLEAMEQIKESSNSISKIIKTIQDIAFQTNLLSLNAAVEAARAGEHGKGFSVVAEEVRNLAGRSQTAAVETTGLIEDSISRVETGSGIAEATSESLDAIVKTAGDVLNIINDISTASQEQAEAISQVSIGLSQISQVVQSNSAVSEETAAASEELNSQAELLQQLVAYFKL